MSTDQYFKEQRGETAYHAEVTRGDETNLPLAGVLILCDVPDLNNLVCAACRDDSTDMRIYVQRRDCTIVRGYSEASW